MPEPPITHVTHAWVSQKAGTGKTTSAVFTSRSLAALGHNVLLVDADKGDSAIRWDDLAGGLGFPVVSMPQEHLDRRLPSVARGRDVVVLDVPQCEDHRRIARGALRAADVWLVPLAPVGIEVDRLMAGGALRELLDDIQAERAETGRPPAITRVVFTRTNTPEPTKTGPDTEVRQVLTDRGWVVCETQVPHRDERFRQTFGTPIDPDPAYDRLTAELLALTPELLTPEEAPR